MIVSSLGHEYFVKWNWDDMMQENCRFNSWLAYGNSKLANVLHGLELSKRLEGKKTVYDFLRYLTLISSQLLCPHI